VLRLDGDMYESTIDALTHLEPLVSPGGYVIVDDYNGIDACRQAVTDHRAAHGITADIHEVDWTAVWWRKPFDSE
jgi:O-methyltransferase